MAAELAVVLAVSSTPLVPLKKVVTSINVPTTGVSDNVSVEPTTVYEDFNWVTPFKLTITLLLDAGVFDNANIADDPDAIKLSTAIDKVPEPPPPPVFALSKAACASMIAEFA